MSGNYTIACAASKYVREQMKVKAANRAADQITAHAFDAAEQTKIPLEDMIAAAGIGDDNMIDCLAWAAVAQRSRISNCLGMAALAFAWIALKQPGTRPVGVYGFMGSTLDPDGGASRVPIRTMAVTGKPVEMNQTRVMILDDVRTETPVFTADHAICVVGDPRLNARGEVTSDDCYVCDPWAQRIYNAVNITAESQLLARVTGGSDRIAPTVRLEAGQTLPATVSDIIGIAA